MRGRSTPRILATLRPSSTRRMSPGQAMKLWLAVTIVLMAGCTPTFVTFQTSRVPFASNSNLETACHTYRTLSFIGVETPAPVLEYNRKAGSYIRLSATSDHQSELRNLRANHVASSPARETDPHRCCRGYCREAKRMISQWVRGWT